MRVNMQHESDEVRIELPWNGEVVVIKFFNELKMSDDTVAKQLTEMIVLRVGKDFELEGECVYSEVFTYEIPTISG